MVARPVDGRPVGRRWWGCLRCEAVSGGGKGVSSPPGLLARFGPPLGPAQEVVRGDGLAPDQNARYGEQPERPGRSPGVWPGRAPRVLTHARVHKGDVRSTQACGAPVVIVVRLVSATRRPTVP